MCLLQKSMSKEPFFRIAFLQAVLLKSNLNLTVMLFKSGGLFETVK